MSLGQEADSDKAPASWQLTTDLHTHMAMLQQHHPQPPFGGEQGHQHITDEIRVAGFLTSAQPDGTHQPQSLQETECVMHQWANGSL